MPMYAALLYTRDVDWTTPGFDKELVEYQEFGEASAALLRGGNALYPTATAVTVRVEGKGGRVIAQNGPYARTRAALTGFYLLDCADLNEAVGVAATIPAAWDGAVEVRPVITYPGG